MEKITYGLLSKYKTELMGIAAASVLITHASDTIIVDNMPYAFKIMSKMGTLFGSQMYMFFFLSGMGSWFSYEKNKDAITYWKNRVKRTVMCYSEFARKYLADTGLPKERTYQTGSPMAEVLHMNLEKIQKSDVLERIMSKMGTLFGSQMYMFFFLSGMGSWFSYEKNKDAITYWKNRVKRTVIPYLLLATVAYAILDLWLQHDVMDFFFDLTCVSFYTKHAGAWYVAVILMLYMIYPLLHVLSKINQKAPVIVALGIGAAYCRLTSNIPFSGNTAYSLENHWGG